ncbi:hypothetical protein [Paenibacillus sp. J2TS4]|nr:hypothetical protein [Paenibacillus sp. J2TS4]
MKALLRKRSKTAQKPAESQAFCKLLDLALLEDQGRAPQASHQVPLR